MENILDDNGFSTVNEPVTAYGFHPETGVYTNPHTTMLVKGFGIPANCTLLEPIKAPKGTVRWNGKEWIDDLEYRKNLSIQERKEKVESIVSTLEKDLTKLDRKKEVNRITEEEDNLRIKIINFLIDLEEFDVSNLEKEVPIFK